MGEAAKVYDNNGKELKTQKGKNIRISEEAWNKIRRYCFNKGIKMGKFTEDSTLEAIKQSKSKK